MIEGTDVFEYFLCPYKVYNRHNRDHKLMVPPSDFTKRLFDLGRGHEEAMVAPLTVVRPRYSFSDLAKGFVETKKIIDTGVPFIYQGVLKDGEQLGIPDLLVKMQDVYIPAEIKISTASKEEQIMQLMFYDMLLEKIQGTSLKKGLLILKNTTELIDLTKYQEKFDKSFAMIEKISAGLEYGMHIDSVCKECPWRNVCVPIALKTKDVSLIYGLSRPMHYKIKEFGINSLTQLKKADTEELATALKTTATVVERWKEQANVLLTQKAKITKVQLPETKNHICLDIETAEDGTLYLIGLWHDGKFIGFFSENDEKKIIDDFIEYLLALGDYKLYHYGVFEKTAFKQLFATYNVAEHIQKEVFSNMIDLFTLVKRNMLLPLKYYNLKDVAKFFGFKWRASDASGSNSMLWFDEWKKTKDEKLLKKILNYNEDDVKGTFVVLQQLIK
jgi:predicted RecB family nuclease